MLAHLLIIASLLLQTSTSQPAAKSPTSRVAPTTTKDTDADPAALLKVKRVYVDSFGDDAISRELQSMIVSSLTETKRFRVTEGTVAGRGAISDSSAHTETVNEAKLSVRLVNPDGDVIWTSTQESKGAKYKGASADVADKCVKKLLRDVEKLEGTGPTPASASPQK